MDQKKCARCGAVTAGSSRFCSRCGASEFVSSAPANPFFRAPAGDLSAPAAAPQSSADRAPAFGAAPQAVPHIPPTYAPPFGAPPQEPPHTAPAYTPPPTPYAMPYGYHAPAAKPKKKSSAGKVAAIIVLPLLLVLIVAVGVFAFLFAPDADKGANPGSDSGSISGSNTGTNTGANTGSNTGANTGSNTGANVSHGQSPDTQQPAIGTGGRTIMIYLVGSNLESGGYIDEGGCASADIQEIMASGADFERNNILLYTGGAAEWQLDGISADQNAIYRVGENGLTLVESYRSTSMGRSDTLSGFISYAMQHFPAAEYGLILWNHGCGPMMGYGVDELHNNDLLELPELEEAFRDAGLGNGSKLEFLGFDACLMSSLEVAWIAADYAEYLIASQEVEPGNGWNYDFLGSMDRCSSGKEIGELIIDRYFAFFGSVMSDDEMERWGLTLSCLDLSQIHAVETSLNNLFSAVGAQLDRGYFPQASKIRYNAKSFGDIGSDDVSTSYDLIDLTHLTQLLSEDYSAEARQLLQDLDRLVCSSRSAVTDANGVSIYHPYHNYSWMDVWVSDYDRFDFAPAYNDYLQDFTDQLNSPGSDSWQDFGSSDSSFDSVGGFSTLTVQLTQEQADNYAGSTYYILRKMDDGGYLEVFRGMDAQLDRSGVLTADYDEMALYLVEDETGNASEFPLTLLQTEVGLLGDSYLTPLLFMRGENMVPVLTQIFTIGGMPIMGESYPIDLDTGIPEKRTLNYADFTFVVCGDSSSTPVYNSNGVLQPFTDWPYTDNSYYTMLTVSNGLHLEYREIEDKSSYYAMVVVEDVYGNQYSTDLIPLAS